VIGKLIRERWKGRTWVDIHGSWSGQVVKSLVEGIERLTIFTCRIVWGCHSGFLLKKIIIELTKIHDRNIRFFTLSSPLLFPSSPKLNYRPSFDQKT
jgi:hypothetical protein